MTILSLAEMICVYTGKLTALTRVHRRHEHELRRERNAAGCARDRDLAILERQTATMTLNVAGH